MAQESTINDILAYNQEFVVQGKAAPFQCGAKPAKRLAVVTCIDMRLITMLTAALGLENGDAVIVKVAGAVVGEPYGETMRSLIVPIHALGVKDVMVIAHSDCKAQQMDGMEMIQNMRTAGIDQTALDKAQQAGVDLSQWLSGFGDMEEAVRRSVALIKEHPLVPAYVNVQGFVMDTQTGALTVVE